MTKIGDIISAIEERAPLALQESYDNAGLQLGDATAEARAALLCIDVTEAVVDEAIERGANLIVSHHPLIFRGLKRITGRTPIERIVAKAIKNDIAIYSAHTNMDSAEGGVSVHAGRKIGLKNIKVLVPQSGKLLKIVTFVPSSHAEAVKQAMWSAGAGKIGNYDSCSYTMSGSGTFRALDGATPFVGTVGEHHTESEERVEVILPRWRKHAVLAAMLAAHPYEEPAFDVIALENESSTGLGVVGDVEPESALGLLRRVKSIFAVGAVSYSGGNVEQNVTRVAFCGGSAAEFIGDAIAAGAQIFITGDVKYHDFTAYNDRIIIANIGHYESEQFTKEVFYDIIQKKIPNFATYYSEKEKNPINYL